LRCPTPRLCGKNKAFAIYSVFGNLAISKKNSKNKQVDAHANKQKESHDSYAVPSKKNHYFETDISLGIASPAPLTEYQRLQQPSPEYA
jgi:hypothetical protein